MLTATVASEGTVVSRPSEEPSLGHSTAETIPETIPGPFSFVENTNRRKAEISACRSLTPSS